MILTHKRTKRNKSKYNKNKQHHTKYQKANPNPKPNNKTMKNCVPFGILLTVCYNMTNKHRNELLF